MGTVQKVAGVLLVLFGLATMFALDVDGSTMTMAVGITLIVIGIALLVWRLPKRNH